MRSDVFAESEELKTLEKYEKAFSVKTEFFSSYSPDFIEQTFVKDLRMSKIEPKTSEKKYKIKFFV